MLPIVAFLVYLTFTVLLFAFGPVEWTVENPWKVYTFLLLAHLALFLGYVSVINRKPRAYKGPWSWQLLLRVALFANLALIIPTIFYRTGGDVDIITALTSPGDAYVNTARALLEEQRTPTVEYSRIILSPLLGLFLPLAVLSWNRLSLPLRVASIVAILGNIVVWVAMGTNKGIADLLVLLPWLLLIPRPNEPLRLQPKSLTKVLGFAIVGLILFLFFLTRGVLSRQLAFGQYGEETGHEATWANAYTLSVPIIPSGAQVGLYNLASNLTQGYYALSNCLEEPFVPMYGIGHSMYLFQRVERTTGVDSMKNLTYPGRIEYTGVLAYRNWHSIYPWIASDVSFPGTLVVVFLIGRFFAYAWLDVLGRQNPFATGVFACFVIMLSYFPANNQIFQSAEGISGFWGLFVLWIFTRTKPSPQRQSGGSLSFNETSCGERMKLMDDRTFPRVLLVNHSPFCRRGNVGIVLSDLFEGWPKERLAAISYSGIEPDFDVCERQWQLTKLGVLQGLVGAAPASAAQKVPGGGPQASPFDARLTKAKRIALPSRLARWVNPHLRTPVGEMIFRMPSAISKPLRAWIDDFNPDLCFSTTGTGLILNVLVRVARERDVPITPYFTDDWMPSLYRGDCFSARLRSSMGYWLDECLKRSPVRLAVTDPMTQEFGARYGGGFETLGYAVDASMPVVPRRSSGSLRVPFCVHRGIAAGSVAIVARHRRGTAGIAPPGRLQRVPSVHDSRRLQSIRGGPDLPARDAHGRLGSRRSSAAAPARGRRRHARRGLRRGGAAVHPVLDVHQDSPIHDGPEMLVRLWTRRGGVRALYCRVRCRSCGGRAGSCRPVCGPAPRHYRRDVPQRARPPRRATALANHEATQQRERLRRALVRSCQAFEEMRRCHQGKKAI